MPVATELFGQIRDADSHEFTPACLWGEMFGDVVAPFAQILMDTWDEDAHVSVSARIERDEAPIDVPGWRLAARAPGAIDMRRRLEVMDIHGVAESFVFASGVGTFGLLAATLPSAEDINQVFAEILDFKIEELFDFDPTPDLIQAIGGAFLAAHNDWCVRAAAISPRLRPVPYLDSSDLSTTLTQAEELISAGLRAIGLASGTPPGGYSPAHPAVDPLWDLLESTNVPLLLHLGGDFGFLRSAAWRNSGGIKHVPSQQLEHPELLVDPYWYSQIHLGCQNFLSTMIFGGVFDRFPNLRVGCIEVSAHWVGSWVENLASIADQFRSLTSKLSLSPSEYLQRNVRVTPYWWEPIDRYIDRFGLEDVYVYGSDYPHFEGGIDPAGIYSANLRRLGPTVARKFFVDNAALLMP
jgi:predicted TIM-barrel fold metal-dependent hydrolase